MEPIKNFRYSYGNLPQEIEKNIYSFNYKKCELAFLASIDGNGKWATDIEDLKFCPHCGAKLYLLIMKIVPFIPKIVPFNLNDTKIVPSYYFFRTIAFENRTISSKIVPYGTKNL